MCNNNEKKSFGVDIIPMILMAYGVAAEKVGEAAVALKCQVIKDLAATANLLARNEYNDGVRTDKVTGFELDPGVEENWVLAFGSHGGPGSLKYKDPEKKAAWIAEQEKRRTGKPETHDENAPRKSRNANK